MLFRINVFILIVLCIAILGYVIVSAQENVRRVEKADAVLTIDGDVMVEGPQNGGPQKTQILLKSEDGKTLIMDASNSNAKGDRRANKLAEKQERKQEKFEAKKERSQDMMQKESLSPDKMRDAEANKKMRGQNMGKEQAGMPAPQGGPPQPQQNQPQGQAIPDTGIQSYLNVILSKNLFMPLGAGRKEQKPSYVLTGVISSDSGKSNNKAIIEQAGGQRSYFVSPGETVEGDTKVTEVDEWQVKMNRSGEQMTLKLGEGTRSGAMQGFRGGGGESPRGSMPGGGGKKGESRTDRPAGVSGGDNFNPDDIPPFVKQMLQQQGISIEDLKNNPDLREKLRQQFQQRFGGGGEGGQGGRGGRNN